MQLIDFRLLKLVGDIFSLVFASRLSENMLDIEGDWIHSLRQADVFEFLLT